jgi:methionyl-tRNA formyltransferase
MISLILSETKRSLEYLKQITKNDIKIKNIILYSKKRGFVFRFIQKKKLNNLLIFLKTNNINSSILEKKFRNIKSHKNIISTYPGEIIKNSSLLQRKLLHCHPGNLPMFKGSTTIYYTLLLKKKICVTLFEVSKKIDSGKILYKKFFKNPKNLGDIEKNFDNKIRSQTLISYLKNKKKLKYKLKKKSYIPYYIAHPLVRLIVINKNCLF